MPIANRILFATLIALAGFVPTTSWGQNWQELGGGFNQPARELVVDPINNELYAIGRFKYVHDSILVNGFTKWDGTQWHELAQIDTACIVACTHLWLAEYYDNAIYVVFDLDPWEGDRHIGRWDGTTFDWDFARVAGNGQTGTIQTLEVLNGQLYAFGTFDTIAGFPIQDAAIWDGTGWSQGPNPAIVDGYVSHAAMYDGNLYVVGNFELDSTRNEISMWDGQAWHAVGNGLPSFGWASTLAVYEGELYVGGHFWKAWGAPGDNIAKWNGTEWSEVGGGTGGTGTPNGQVRELLVHDGYLYAVGQFEFAGGIRADCFARWDGNEWCVFGDTLDNAVSDLVVYDGSLIMSGAFWTINGDSSLQKVARLNTSAFVDSCGVIQAVPVHRAANQMSLYPNPASESVTVVLPTQSASGQIRMFDLTGREMATRPTHNYGSTFQLSLSGIPPGLYFIEAQVDQHRYRSMLVVH